MSEKFDLKKRRTISLFFLGAALISSVLLTSCGKKKGADESGVAAEFAVVML